MDLELSVHEITVKEKYYATIRKGYALGFIVAFTNDEEEPSDQKILNTVAFR
jgi:hypothetical protein